MAKIKPKIAKGDKATNTTIPVIRIPNFNAITIIFIFGMNGSRMVPPLKRFRYFI